MTEDIVFHRDGWPDASSADAEVSTVTRLRISVLGEILTRNVSKRGGGESEAINTSLLPLGEFLANNWWTLLHEPLRPTVTDAFRVRHRLDSGMSGYAFPAIALWSGGEQTIMADWAPFENPFSTVSFLTSRPVESLQLGREAVEDSLLDLMETIVERASEARQGAVNISEAWDRVRQSIANTDEYSYCVAAGRLGVDPYDPNALDLTKFAKGISEALFGDISEIVEVEDLQDTTPWIHDAEARLKLFPETDLSYFGQPATDDLKDAAWVAGVASAELLRAHCGISANNPRVAVDELFGAAAAQSSALAESGPEGIIGLSQRLDRTARIGTVAGSARQRRFRACSTIYMAWNAASGEDRASTTALTRRQQAGRAFAAEMLAPQHALLARATHIGFDDDDLLELASEFFCPYQTVMWQSYRAGIPLRGIEIPRMNRGHVMTARASL